MTSGYPESEVARRGIAVAPGGFLHKPHTPQELLAAVESARRGAACAIRVFAAILLA